MAVAPVDVVRELYGHNWTSLRSRREGLEVGAHVFADDFEYHLDPTVFGDRTLGSVQDVAVFLEGFEADFRDLRQRPERVVEAAPSELGERVVVLGEIIGRGRLSGLPFRSSFGHVWTIRDGRAVRLEGYLDHDVALAAAGLV